MFQISFSHASFHSKENGKSFGWDWKIVWLRTFYRFPQWKKAERYTFYLSSRNMLYDSLLSYNLKDETSFWEISGGDAVQRSKGQNFLSLQTNKNLCLIKDSLRFLRWPIIPLLLGVVLDQKKSPKVLYFRTFLYFAS